MARRPLIGITGGRRGGRSLRWLIALGVWQAGGHIVQLSPARPDPPRPLDGVVISGGHDVEPVLYKQAPLVESRYDTERDAFESLVIDSALARGLPLLGICRGAQLLNVRLGGSLHQDLGRHRQRTSSRRTILPLKTLRLDPGSRLRAILGRERLRINSLHDQAIDELGSGLRRVGWDIDGITQAVEHEHARLLLGVQWHPEFLLLQSTQRRLFRALVSAADRGEQGPDT